MPDNTDAFRNNPFLLLDPGQYPENRAALESGRGIARGDQELFLRAFHNLPEKVNPGKARRSSGFTIAEQCQLPALLMKKKPKPVKPALPKSDEKKEENDLDLFAAAMRNARPLGGKGRKVPAMKPKKAELSPEREPELADYLDVKLEFAVSCSDEYLEGRAVGLDELLLNRLREGQFSPEAHLDLHGLNVEQAFESLKEFMRQAWFKGLRVALVVTGRGRNSPAGMAILRQKLPYWLTHEPFKRIVLAFCTARPHDGGPGSIYVLLRKARKKGPVRWETLAFDMDGF